MQMVNRGGVAEMASLLLLIAQETEQKLTAKPEADGEAKSDAEKNTAGVAGSSSSGGAGDKPPSSYSGVLSGTDVLTACHGSCSSVTEVCPA